VAAQEGGATKSSGAEAASNKMVASFLALQLFCEVCPELGVEHIPTLVRRGYLKSSTKGTKQQIKNSFYVVYYTAKILAGTIPLSKKLSPEMLKDLETTLIQLVITATALSVVEAAIKCLSCCVEQTKNMPLVTQTLQKFYNYLKNEHDGKQVDQDEKRIVWINRSLFVSGLFCKHFDFSSGGQKKRGSSGDEELQNDSIRDVVFMVQTSFASHQRESVKLKALPGLGHLCTRHPHYLVRDDIKNLYSDILGTNDVNTKAQVLENLRLVLVHEEEKMNLAAEQTTAKTAANAKLGKSTTIVGIGGEDSGCSGIILSHLEHHIKDNVLSTSPKLRQACFIVMMLMLRQGLVHPMEHAAHLIALGTDPIETIRVTAQRQLEELHIQYPVFVIQKALEGLITTFDFKTEISAAKAKADPDAIIQGFKQGKQEGDCSSELRHLYTLLKNKRNIRRCFSREVVDEFRKAGPDLRLLIFLGGNLAHFPYAKCEEPLYIIHEITMLTAVRGTQIQSTFRMLLGESSPHPYLLWRLNCARQFDKVGLGNTVPCGRVCVPWMYIPNPRCFPCTRSIYSVCWLWCATSKVGSAACDMA
jgi:hypothetical protein